MNITKEIHSKMQEYLAVAKANYLKAINSNSLSQKELEDIAEDYIDAIRGIFKEYGKSSKDNKDGANIFINWLAQKHDANLSYFGKLVTGWAAGSKKDYQVVCAYSGEERVLVSKGEGREDAILISTGEDGTESVMVSVGSKYDLVHDGVENNLRTVMTAGVHLVSEFVATLN